MKFLDLISETQAHLRSFVRDQEISTHLTADLAVDEFTIPVNDATLVSRGRIEIGNELIWIDKSDRGASTAEVPPYGRGMDGTDAEPHESGTRIIVAPLYPRRFLKDTINQTIKQIGASLYGVDTLEEITYRDGEFKYQLPIYTRDVLSVKVTDPDWVDDVTFLRNWAFDKNAPVSVSSTGKAVYLYDDWIGGGIDLTVTISRDPAPLVNDDDDFTATFLPESASDLPVLGAAARLLSTSDSYDLQTRSVEANTINANSRNTTPAQDQSKYLQALFMQRMDEERLRLLNTTNNKSRYENSGMSARSFLGWTR